MAGFKITDKHILFAHAIAEGKHAYEAYLQYLAKKKCSKKTAAATASRMMQRPMMQDLLTRIREERQKALIENTARVVAPEFNTQHLTVDELDSFHYAVIQGRLTVEEIVPTFTYEYDKEGKLTKRSRSFVKITRLPNIREKQISVDAIYKRLGKYAPGKLWAAWKDTGQDNMPGDDANVSRMIILSSGEKIPL